MQRGTVILALLADWANGIFAVLGAAWLTGTEIVWWHFLIGIALSHLPDIDALPELWRHGQVGANSEQGHDHREGLHYPLPVLLGAFILAPMLGYWGWVLAFNVALHFFNDFYGAGWGIKVFWPFTDRQYKLLGRRANQPKRVLRETGAWERLSEAERRLRFVVSWSPSELPAYIAQWGMPDWIEKIYFRLNWISGMEILVFLLAVGLMVMVL